MRFLCLIAILIALCAPRSGRAESQGVSDPFGDPDEVEAEQPAPERHDKKTRVFHLTRSVMLGADVGAGVFTGGLGQTNATGAYFGARLVYFFDDHLALEFAVHYAHDVDTISPPNTTNYTQIDTQVIPITVGLRYSIFDGKASKRAIVRCNPYLIGGPGVYLRQQSQIQHSGIDFTPGSPTSFGVFAGGGVEFAVYDRSLFLGVDLRYHLVFWSDADDTMGNLLKAGARSGGYFTPVATLTYSF